MCYEYIIPNLRIWDFVIIKEYFVPGYRIKVTNEYVLNAFSCGIFWRRIYSNSFVENECTQITKQCIINHEIGHVKYFHHLQSFLLTVIFIILCVYLHWSVVLPYLAVQKLLGMWHEIQADNYASKIVGQKNYLNFLNLFNSKSVNYRKKWIQKRKY